MIEYDIDSIRLTADEGVTGAVCIADLLMFEMYRRKACNRAVLAHNHIVRALQRKTL